MSLFKELVEKLNLSQLDTLKFEGLPLFIGSPMVYGGHVLAQSIIAAQKCVNDDKILHSMHGYFLHPGDNEMPITYDIEPIKKGRSFDVIRVKASQKNTVIFILAASFHKKEESISHQESMPNVAGPEGLKSFSSIMSELTEGLDFKLKGMFSDETPFLIHPVEHFNPLKPGKKPALNHMWFKPNGDVESNSIMNAAFLAYMSDFNLLVTALRPHDLSFFTTPMQIASLDHAMWFHRWPISNDWHLYVIDSPTAQSARGFCRGKIFDREGNLISSVAQEGLIRLLK